MTLAHARLNDGDQACTPTSAVPRTIRIVDSAERVAAQKAFEAVVSVRNLDTELVWTRSSYMLTWQAAVLVVYGLGVTSAQDAKTLTGWVLALGASVVGVFLALSFMGLVRVGWAWTNYWNSELARLEGPAFGDATFLWRITVGWSDEATTQARTAPQQPPFPYDHPKQSVKGHLLRIGWLACTLWTLLAVAALWRLANS